MRPVTIYLAAIVLLAVGACSVSKKKVGDTTTAPPVPPIATTTRMGPSVVSSTGIFEPGNAELTAIQARHKEVTMQTLQEGHKLYVGVCTNCHLAKSIYERPEAAWPNILISMAKEANITDVQREAIYKYVMAIKATQPM